MSEQPRFSRDNGFVALPVGIMDLDLSPGAFRTLAELCRMANAQGECWPSLAQLSERLGRSRAAISGYVDDLRRDGLVETVRQTTANGYNYRLKYRVTFWEDWRASLRPAPARKSERSDQPAERLKESKKHIHINHQEDDTDKLIRGWTRCFAGAPYPAVSHPPPEKLLVQTREQLATGPARTVLSDETVKKALLALWQQLKVSVGGMTLNDQVAFIRASKLTEAELVTGLQDIRKSWPRHWHREPSAEAFSKLLKATVRSSRSSRTAVLNGFLKRWQLAEKTLRRGPRSCSVGKDKPAPDNAGQMIYPRI
ncbi:helix-turn-helix domain-containing protein [uncultured Roseobacter sp.]|uniref:helix-turn-helix domain-containing protein n=1 Tax=uncultured Roseobacter sp. TaxID=114847 RepID=UPI00262AD4C7|nr:helix-turn-helix domain-containing protein [uncultured Roseobacter sp.]